MKKDHRHWQDSDYAWERIKRNLTVGAVIAALYGLYLAGTWVWERIF